MASFKYELTMEQREAIANKITSLNEFEQSFCETLEKYNYTIISEKQFSVLKSMLQKVGYTGEIKSPDFDPEWLTKRLDSIEAKLDMLIKILAK